MVTSPLLSSPFTYLYYLPSQLMRQPFEIADGVEDITISHLRIPDSDIAIFADDASQTRGIAISNSEIYGQRRHGIYFGSSSDQVSILDNTISNNGFWTYDAGRREWIPSVNHGVFLLGTNVEVRVGSASRTLWTLDDDS